MVLCLFQYLVQANISGSNLLFPLSVDGIQAIVQCEPTKGAKALSYGTTNFEWTIPDDSSPEMGTITLPMNGPDGQQSVPRKIRITRDSKHIYGVIDYFAQTTIWVFFEANEEAFHNDLANLVAASASVLHRFLRVYAAITNLDDIGAFRLGDSTSVICAFANPYEFRSDRVGGTFSNFRLSFTVGLPVGLFNPELSDDEKGRIQARLVVDEDLKLHEQLSLDARELALLKGDYNLAIVTAGTAFEIFLQYQLGVYCAKVGISHLPGGNQNRNVPYQDAIEKGNVQADLLRYVDHVLHLHRSNPSSVFNSSEWTAWKRDAYELRNRIIHRGATGATYAEYEAAAVAITTFIRYIEAKLT